MSGKYIDEEVFEYALWTIMKDVIEGDQALQEKLDKFEITTSVIKLDIFILLVLKQEIMKNIFSHKRMSGNL